MFIREASPVPDPATGGIETQTQSQRGIVTGLQEGVEISLRLASTDCVGCIGDKEVTNCEKRVLTSPSTRRRDIP